MEIVVGTYFIFGVGLVCLMIGIVVGIGFDIKGTSKETVPSVKSREQEWLWQKYKGISMRPVGICPVRSDDGHTIDDLEILHYYDDLERAFDRIRDCVIVSKIC